MDIDESSNDDDVEFIYLILGNEQDYKKRRVKTKMWGLFCFSHFFALTLINNN